MYSKRLNESKYLLPDTEHNRITEHNPVRNINISQKLRPSYVVLTCRQITFFVKKKITQYNSTYQDAGDPDRLDPSGKFVENSAKKPTCHEINGYQIKDSPVLWLLELQIRRGPKV